MRRPLENRELCVSASDMIEFLMLDPRLGEDLMYNPVKRPSPSLSISLEFVKSGNAEWP